MTNQEHFDRSVGILVKAFFEGELEAMSCAACACGNLIAAANGYTVKPLKWLGSDGLHSGESISAWRLALRFPNLLDEEGLARGYQQVESTGYGPDEFRRIEDAFMNVESDEDTSKEQQNFDGLMNVVDVLADIHGVDLSAASAAKALFVKVEA